jgi:hypothetical protein
MEMQKVKSSNILAVGYDEDARKLVVEFHSGKKYAYHSVPPEVHEAFLGAKSMGIFFVREVKGQYYAEKL